MEMNDYQKLWDRRAIFFDIDYKDYEQDFSFFLDACKKSGDSVLELGCGTGRLLFFLFQSQHCKDVSGRDLSKEMLEEAQKKINKSKSRIRLIHGDMRDFHIGRNFHLIFTMGNSFFMMDTEGKRSTLNHVKEHLKDEGNFVVEVANPKYLLSKPQDTFIRLRTVNLPESQKNIVIFYTQKIEDNETNKIKIIWFRDEIDENGSITRKIFPITFHCLFFHEMEKLLIESGFKIMESYGSFYKHPFNENSKRMIFFCTIR